MIDVSDMDSFLSKTAKMTDISDMDSFLLKTANHDAPNYANAKPSQDESFIDSLKRGFKEVTDFGELGLGTKRFGYDKSQNKVNDFIAEIAGQKGELTGATTGALMGLNYASKAPIPNPLIKGAAMGVGAAIGGGAGYIGDKGEKATPQGTASAMGNAVAGEMIGAGIPVIAGKAYNKMGEVVSDKISKYVYGALDPTKAKDILELASAKGVRLLPNQVADNKAIDQLLSVIGQNPVASQRINSINKTNKTALMHELNSILNDMGVDSVAIRSANDIDPLGTSLKGFLSEAKQGRTYEIQNAYKEFERHAGAFSTDSKPIADEIAKLKDLSQSMPNPQGYERAVESVLGKLDGKVTAVDLNNVIKQINYNMKHLGKEDYAIEYGYKKMRDIVDGHLETLSKTDGSYTQLQKAKGLYSQKRTIYDRPEIQSVLKGTKDAEEIYDTLLRGEGSITNAKILRDELVRTKDGEKILGTLARRQIDEALYKTRMNQNIFKDGELDSHAFLKIMDEIDYRQLEILGGKPMVDNLHEMRQLVNLIDKQDRILSGTGGGLNTMGMIKSGVMNGLASVFRIRTLGEVLTSDVAHNQMLDMLRIATRNQSNPNKAPQVMEALTQKQKEILNALQ